MRDRLIPLFLAISFLFIGCASGISNRSTAVKRAIETNEYDVNVKTLMTASVGAFQDLGYTIDVLNGDYGLITASKTLGTQTTEVNNSTLLDDVVAGLFGFESRSDDIVISPLELSVTITVKELSTEPVISSLRVNFESGGTKYSDLFFKSFFAAIDQSLFLDTTIE